MYTRVDRAVHTMGLDNVPLMCIHHHSVTQGWFTSLIRLCTPSVPNHPCSQPRGNHRSLYGHYNFSLFQNVT